MYSLRSGPRRVRFNPREKLYIVTRHIAVTPAPSDNETSDPPPRASPPTPSSDEPSTPPLPNIQDNIRIWDEDDSRHAYYSTESTHIQMYAKPSFMAPPLSASMLSAQRIPWDVHSTRGSTVWDGDYASVIPRIPQIILRSDRLMDDILVTPAPGLNYITVGRVYGAIRATLEAQISTDSSMFGIRSDSMKRIIWEESQRRRGDKGIQYMDFLLDDHVLVGISVEPGARYWLLHFDRSKKNMYRSP